MMQAQQLVYELLTEFLAQGLFGSLEGLAPRARRLLGPCDQLTALLLACSHALVATTLQEDLFLWAMEDLDCRMGCKLEG